jgi:hypothetical protein
VEQAELRPVRAALMMDRAAMHFMLEDFKQVFEKQDSGRIGEFR